MSWRKAPASKRSPSKFRIVASIPYGSFHRPKGCAQKTADIAVVEVLGSGRLFEKTHELAISKEVLHKRPDAGMLYGLENLSQGTYHLSDVLLCDLQKNGWITNLRHGPQG